MARKKTTLDEVKVGIQLSPPTETQVGIQLSPPNEAQVEKYHREQEAWVIRHDIRSGQPVKVFRTAKQYERGWEACDPPFSVDEDRVGRECLVLGNDFDENGIWVTDEQGVEAQLPYFVLRPIKRTTAFETVVLNDDNLIALIGKQVRVIADGTTTIENSTVDGLIALRDYQRALEAIAPDWPTGFYVDDLPPLTGEFANWVFGGYAAKFDEDGIYIGCQVIDWERVDEFIFAIKKVRAKTLAAKKKKR